MDAGTPTARACGGVSAWNTSAPISAEADFNCSEERKAGALVSSVHPHRPPPGANAASGPLGLERRCLERLSLGSPGTCRVCSAPRARWGGVGTSLPGGRLWWCGAGRTSGSADGLLVFLPVDLLDEVEEGDVGVAVLDVGCDDLVELLAVSGGHVGLECVVAVDRAAVSIWHSAFGQHACAE